MGLHRRAVVIGAGIAGLMAARVASEHFAEVVVIERDGLNPEAVARRRVPQGRHGHNLLVRGLQIMDRLFPGLQEDLVNGGAVRVRPEAVAWNHAGGWKAMPGGRPSALSLSRPFLESTIMLRVRQLPNVSFMEETRASHFVIDADGAVCGVAVGRKGSEDVAADVSADLVIDSSGSGTFIADWMISQGFSPPRCERLASPVTYSSALFERRGFQQWQLLLVGGSPRMRTGVALPIEGDRWLVSFGAMFDVPAPRSPEEFMDFAAALDVPDMYELLKNSRQIGEISSMRFSASERQRFEELPRLPPGLIAIGDAVCRFNPLLGQGMTVAAIEAEALQTLLASPSYHLVRDAGFPRRWYAAISPAIDQAWMSVASEHYRYAQFRRETPWRMRVIDWYLRRLDKASQRDAAVTNALLDVTSFRSASKTLLAPRTVAKVFLSSL